jgi:hypothetical protein
MTAGAVHGRVLRVRGWVVDVGFAAGDPPFLHEALEVISDEAGPLEDLRRTERELRQEEITTELLDVVTGAEAITNDGRGRPHG